MPINNSLTKLSFWRSLVQWGFLGWILFIGIQFGLFVRHFETAGATPLYVRPPGVEGFLPIGALANLKYWLTSGVFSNIHPAALVLFLTFLAMSLLAKKSFCSWLCPVGTLSELVWKIGQRLFGRTFRIWTWLDVLLRGVKYALLLFFIKIILLDMPARALGGFVNSPYWKLSDVKMLHFFTNISMTALAIIGVLTALSLVYKNAWCRYLCPYGALLGLLSMASPLKIHRDTATCTGCQGCSRACPSLLPVHRKMTVRSPECTGCVTCVEVCPERSLAMAPPVKAHSFPRWAFPVIALGIYAGGVAFGMATGHWHSSLTYADYQHLIPMINQLGM